MTRQPPSPWLNHPEHRTPQPTKQASFVEYLRWMRVKQENSSNSSVISSENNGTILEIFEKFSENDFSRSLQRLTNRTQRLASPGYCFPVTCPWRIRVGGVRGPESMLLPAFDAQGLPYIPSSTLKGVARAVATQAASRENSDLTVADIQRIFGSINPVQQGGQVIFLDAYPLPQPDDNQGGLLPDMVNAIWQWGEGGLPNYKAEPHDFLSLYQPTFLIGLRLADGAPANRLDQVKQWLINGLAQGIGSRVNSGYGTLEAKGETMSRKKKLLEVKFRLHGQLIYGSQEFTGWKENQSQTNWKPPGRAIVEVRPVAFRSILRYWFRTFALGVLTSPTVQALEQEIFGGIGGDKPQTGLFRIEISSESELVMREPSDDQDDLAGLARGILILRNSSQTSKIQPEARRSSLTRMLQTITWLMFHLGGVGRGARRPCYSRQSRRTPPWWRGSTLEVLDRQGAWQIPPTLEIFQQRFQRYLQDFYTALGEFSNQTIDTTHPRIVPITRDWVEAIDRNCQIVCVQSQMQNDKPFSLAQLHQQARQGNSYNPQLCGSTDRPSPIWIAKVGKFEVVTVFGATQDPRQRYLSELRQRCDRQNYAQIFPLQ